MKTSSILSLALCALLLAAALARAENECDTVYSSESDEDWKTAYQVCLPLAEQGDATAQALIGWMYYSGRVVAQDSAQAVSWWHKAAEQGNVLAQYNLGVAHDSGRGVTEDDTQAVYWWRKAAEQGDAQSQFDLGAMYEYGKGVARDYTQAMHWYRKAAEQGNVWAKSALDNMAEGKSVDTLNDANVQFNLGLMYDEGEGLLKDDVQAVRWYSKAAEQGHAEAQNKLGWMYKNGKGVSKDDAQAVHWWRKAAEQGLAVAQAVLGWMYYRGEGVVNYAQALLWFRKAAEQGVAVAQYGLGALYYKGKGVPKNYTAAYQWISLAAAQGDEKAGEFLDALGKEMTPDQIAEAQKQAAEWLKAYPNAAE